MNKEYLKLIKVEFMHGVEEPWCNNQGVVFLPYGLKDNKYHYLLIKEYNPLFKNKQINKYSTITGGLEKHSHYETVINEMFEETGIDLSKLGLDLTLTYKGTGDGSTSEKQISARFVSNKNLNKSNDALSLATHSKLTLKNLIRFDKNINQKLDMILQILNEQKNSMNKSDQSSWKD